VRYPICRRIIDNLYELHLRICTSIRNNLCVIFHEVRVSKLKSWRVGNCEVYLHLRNRSTVSRKSQEKSASRNCFSFANERIINCLEFLEIRFFLFARGTARARASFSRFYSRDREKSRRKNWNDQLSLTSPNKKIVSLYDRNLISRVRVSCLRDVCLDRDFKISKMLLSNILIQFFKEILTRISIVKYESLERLISHQ